MIQDITLTRVLQKMSNLENEVIIGELDNFIIYTPKSHFKASNLTCKDTALLLDIYKQKMPKIQLKIRNPLIIAQEITELFNYEIPCPDEWIIKYTIHRRNKKTNKI